MKASIFWGHLHEIGGEEVFPSLFASGLISVNRPEKRMEPLKLNSKTGSQRRVDRPMVSRVDGGQKTGRVQQPRLVHAGIHPLWTVLYPYKWEDQERP